MALMGGAGNPKAQSINLPAKSAILEQLTDEVATKLGGVISRHRLKVQTVWLPVDGTEPALKHLNAGLAKEALEHLEGMLQRTKSLPAPFYYDLGLLYEVNGRLEDAEAMYKAAALDLNEIYLKAINSVRQTKEDQRKLAEQQSGAMRRRSMCAARLMRIMTDLRRPCSLQGLSAALGLTLLILFSISSQVAFAQSVFWLTPPPSSVDAGQPFGVGWMVSGGSPTHVNVHWDPTNPGTPSNPAGNINPSTCTAQMVSCSTFSPTSSPMSITAPTLTTAGTPLTAPTVVLYVVHARINGIEVFSDTRAVTVRNRQ